MRTAPLRHRLVALTVAAILPLAALAGIGLYVFARQQRAQIARVGLELTRSVANAVDAELRSELAILQTLAATDTLDDGNLAGFRELASRVLAQHPQWATIILADLRGNIVVDIGNASISRIVEQESFDRVVRTLTPAVGSLAQRPENGAWLFAIRTPVVRNAGARYVMTALVKPDTIRDVVARQRVPPDWVISIVDARGRRVARSRAHEATLGGRLSESVEQVVASGGEEGVGVATSLEGDRIFTPYSRLASSGWAAVFGIPTAILDAAMYRSLAVYGSGLVLSIGLATLGAFWVARRITKPIGALGAAAEALGRRQMPSWQTSAISEIDAVGKTLESAHNDLVRAGEERESLLRKEREARTLAEEADRAKDQFMAVLSHELRTPLNAVYGWASMLHAGQASDAALREHAGEVILRNTKVLTRLIDDLLDVSRISTGKMRLEVRSVDLRAVITQALETVRLAADAKEIALLTVIDDGIGSVTGDAARLQQVVWNLLMNAVKFSRRGGQVRLAARRRDDRVQIVVSDNGLGITAEMLPHIFERFRQADNISAPGGLGLGLTLVKHLVELHGGSVTAHSDGADRGATFTVSLPRTITGRELQVAHPAATVLSADASAPQR